MKSKVLFIERKPHEFYSLEKVFRQIAGSLNRQKFEYSFVQMPNLSSLAGMLKNLFAFRPPPADIYHITGDVHYIALLLAPRRTLLTVHDANVLNTRKGLRRFFIKKLWFDLPLGKLKYVTAISETAKNELIANGCDGAKIRVIENPVEEKLFDVPAKDFDAVCPNILHIGTAPHKNLPRLIRALENIKCRLTIIGKIDAETSALLAEKNIVFENKFELDDEQIREEYRKADLVAFCSTYEGFGLPIVEAQAARTPLVTSDLEPMRSVAGKGAVLCDPFDAAEISAAIREIIENAELRKRIVREGSENVRRFHPKMIASRYEELYAEMLSAEN